MYGQQYLIISNFAGIQHLQPIHVILEDLTGTLSIARNYMRCLSLGTVPCSDISICVHRNMVPNVNGADYLHCKFKGLGFNQTTKTNTRRHRGTLRIPKD